MAMAGALGRLAIPILVQQTLDRGILGRSGFRGGFILAACVATAALSLALYLVGVATYRRLVRATEDALYGLRVKVFEHLHALAIADHTESRRGVLVSRVTSDIETLARFAEWGAIAWAVNASVVVGVIVVMFVYSWQLTLVVLVVFVPLALALKAIQSRQLRAYDELRNRVGDALAEFSETISAAPLVRAYGLTRRARTRLDRVVEREYRARMHANKFQASIFPLSDVFGAFALAAVAGLGAWYGPGWGLAPGRLVAFLFLVNLVLAPISEITEVLDMTQSAIAGWRKVLAVLDLPIEVVEPVPGAGRPLPSGSLDIRVEHVDFAYRDGRPVLRDVDVAIPAGTSVAVVGETGSGKTTFAKLLCRLIDPTAGRILLGGVDLREVDPQARLGAIRMVPQDGFLFDTTVRENVRMGRLDATDGDVDAAFRALGLDWWVSRLPGGLDAPAGQRGSNLSVGERQLVALARAQLADPGLLILDEATSAVDPETEQALADALDRLAAGRTTVSVAHRLSTAERAAVVLVFDDGRIVERGHHRDLLAAGGTYARLHRSWVGATRAA
ncbi:MAG: ABC transporter ATP-binding protein [Actinobacteria bacterium]|nr:ABC transporter ATP-binding protein [Actinomycetota bacterium]